MEEDDLLVLNEPDVSEFVTQQYESGSNGAIPELSEDYYLIKDGYRSRER